MPQLTSATVPAHMDTRTHVLQPTIRYFVGVVSGGELRLIDAEFHEMRPRVKLLEQVETTQRELGSRDQIYAAQAQLTASFGGWWVVVMAYGVWLVDSSPALCPLPRLSLPPKKKQCVCALSGRDGSHTVARTATTHVLGGKAKKAKLSALTQYRTDADSIRSSHALTASKVTHETSVASADPDAGRVIPPYDKSATEAANAYPLNKSTSRQRRLPSVSRVRLVFSHPLWLGIPVATAWPIDYATPFVSRDIDTDMVVVARWHTGLTSTHHHPHVQSSHGPS
jgi:hypothetical protein